MSNNNPTNIYPGPYRGAMRTVNPEGTVELNRDKLDAVFEALKENNILNNEHVRKKLSEYDNMALQLALWKDKFEETAKSNKFLHDENNRLNREITTLTTKIQIMEHMTPAPTPTPQSSSPKVAPLEPENNSFSKPEAQPTKSVFKRPTYVTPKETEPTDPFGLLFMFKTYAATYFELKELPTGTKRSLVNDVDYYKIYSHHKTNHHQVYNAICWMRKYKNDIIDAAQQVRENSYQIDMFTRSSLQSLVNDLYRIHYSSPHLQSNSKYINPHQLIMRVIDILTL